MKFYFLLLSLLLVPIIAQADEPVLGYEEKDIPVVNETLRQLQDDVRDIKLGVQVVVTIAADDITPDISGGSVFITQANTGATAITDLDNPRVGQIVCLVGGSATNSSTIADSGNFKLSGAGWTGSLDETLILFVKEDNYYIELSRSTN